MSTDTRTPVLDRLCPCGHMRRDHVDAYQRCDDCDCPKYRGPIEPVTPPVTIYPTAAPLPRDPDDDLFY